MLRYASHWRSGSHAFGQVLKTAFYPHRELGGRVTRSGQTFAGPDGSDWCPWADLFAGHSIAAEMRWAVDIYLVRDGRDVLLSCAEFYGRQDDLAGFLREKNALAPYLGESSWMTPVEHWWAHIERWEREDAVPVRYEDLTADTGRVVRFLAEWFDVPAKVVPDSTGPPVGYRPGPGRPGRWRDAYGPDALETFHSLVPVTHWTLGPAAEADE